MSSPTLELLAPDIRELIAEGDYRGLREAMREFEPADIAELLAGLLEEEVNDDAADAEAAAAGPGAAEPAPDRRPGRTGSAVLFRVLPRDTASRTFAHLDAEEQESLLANLGDERAVRLIENMDADDRARLLDELPVEVAERILGRLTAATRRQVQAILGYPEETVGRLMTPEFVRVKPAWTVERAVEHVRRYGHDAETIHWIYVVDDERRLIDDLHIRQILLAQPEATIESLMDNRFIALGATEDREEAVRIMNRYDRTAMPVIDSRGLLVGIVTYDDVADVAEEEATEDIQKLGGMEALGHDYLDTKFWEMVRKRGPWLAGLFAMQIVTILVMRGFESTLEEAIVLAAFVPLIISSGGNTGTQAASLVVRALALQQVRVTDYLGVLWHELRTGTALGIVLGVLGFAAVTLLNAVGLTATDHAGWVALVVGGSVLGIVIWGVVIGAMLPILLQRIKLDPATSSSPLVATLMDCSGLLIYFSLASVLLQGRLL